MSAYRTEGEAESTAVAWEQTSKHSAGGLPTLDLMLKFSRGRSVPPLDPDGPRTPGVEPAFGATTSRKRRRLVVAVVVTLAVAGVLLVNAVLVERQSRAASEGSMMDVDGVSMYVRQDGPRDGPALVLIHGLGGSTSWWDAVVPLFAASHHVIRVDLLGHGRSAKPTGAG